MSRLLTIAHLTLHEAARRRILLSALVLGAAFLVLFGIGVHFIGRDLTRDGATPVERRMLITFITLAGLYAVNFLTVMAAILIPIDTLSGEIASGVMQTLASKPIRRAEIVLGKWLGSLAVVAGYLVVMAGGTIVVARLVGGVAPPNLERGLPLMLLEATVLVTLTIAAGTRFGTVTNGVIVFGLYGLAFIGGWVEQVSTFAGKDAARNVGTVASLLMPTESMWQLAAHHMQPAMMRDLAVTPFSPASVPSPAMVVWTAGYVLAVLALALRTFARRSL
jgi:hypothetical protein